jgi:hypothetical protein
MLLIDSALRGKDVTNAIKDIDDFLTGLIAPKNFNPEDTKNIVVFQEKSFERICAALEELGVHEPGKLSVYKFYNKIEYFKNKPRPKTGRDKENI